VADAARQKYSFEEYLQLEELSPAVKHEFLRGEVWAMAGGSPDHAAIAADVTTLLNNQLRDQPCRVYSSDLRVRVTGTGLATYPDVTVVCGKLEVDPEDRKGHTAVNPRLVIEVLSPSTEDYDRGEKLDQYKRVESLQEVVLISHDERCVEIVRRSGDGWVRSEHRDGAPRLVAVACVLPVDEVYRDPLATA
jgi:Uma2 family endonuclease